MIEARQDVLGEWIYSDEPLSGGEGKKIMVNRAIPVKDRKSLLQHTAEIVEIRSTGHSWCISGTKSCDGQGVYDPTMCSDCSKGVIDQSHVPVWQMIHLDNLRLAAVLDCGPGALQMAERAASASRRVLIDLGVPEPTIDSY